MLLKKKADGGEEYRKELAAENNLLKDQGAKSKADAARLEKELSQTIRKAEETITGLRAELVKLRKSSWEQTSVLRSKVRSGEERSRY